ncbi:MAG: hypothetical protein JW881_09785 [Spirochaetales bacterium]|nr:hypothetical protein [Spirochaetales bacterium]
MLYHTNVNTGFIFIICFLILSYLFSCQSINAPTKNRPESKFVAGGESPASGETGDESMADMVPPVEEDSRSQSAGDGEDDRNNRRDGVREIAGIDRETEDETEIVSEGDVYEYQGFPSQDEADVTLSLMMPEIRLKPVEDKKESTPEKKEVIAGTAVEKNITKKETKAENNAVKRKDENKKKPRIKPVVDKKNQKEESVEPVKEITARPGDDIEISLNKIGWIFHGYEKNSDAGCFKLISKQTGYGETLFLFRALKPCIMVLRFSLQDNYSGIEQQETVRVHVTDDTEVASGMNDTSDFYTQSNRAEALYEAGKYDAALEEYLSRYTDGSSFLNDRIAELYALLGDDEKAAGYWEKNIDDEQEFGENAVRQLFRIAVKRKNASDIARLLEEIFRFRPLPPVDHMITAMEVFTKSNDAGVAVASLEKYLDQYDDQTGKDYLYYMLAGFYERSGAMRDLKYSRYYYEKVCDEFPSSPWALPAAERVMYLNRHFFFVQ